MKKILLLSAMAVCSSSVLSAQAITFAIEKNQLFFEDGSVAGRDADSTVDNRDLLTVWAGFAAGEALADFNSGIASYKIDGSVDTLNSTLGALIWTAVPEGAGLLAGSRDYNLSAATGAQGSSPILLVSTASSFANFAAGDQLGLVSSTTTVSEFGTQTVSFTSATSSWNVPYLGTLGSLTFESVSAVPEPSTYAALAGLCALGAVMVRRRRS